MASNKTERLHVVGTAFVALLILAGGWFLFISPQRSETADVQAQTADAQLQNTTRQSRIAQLGGEQKQWAKFSAALAAARAALPVRGDETTFLRQLQATGAATNTTVSAISIGDAEAITPPAAPVADPSATTPAPSAAPAGGSTAGILQIPISATVAGTNTATSAFLTRLQTTLPRAVLITEVTRGSDVAGGASTMQLKIAIFTVPTPGTAASTTPAGS